MSTIKIKIIINILIKQKFKDRKNKYKIIYYLNNYLKTLTTKKRINYINVDIFKPKSIRPIHNKKFV